MRIEQTDTPELKFQKLEISLSEVAETSREEHTSVRELAVDCTT
jgi:hypothetical protein